MAKVVARAVAEIDLGERDRGRCRSESCCRRGLSEDEVAGRWIRHCDRQVMSMMGDEVMLVKSGRCQSAREISAAWRGSDHYEISNQSWIVTRSQLEDWISFGVKSMRLRSM